MDDSLDSTLDREFTRATRLTIGALVALVALEVVIFVVVFAAVSYTHLRAHETVLDLVCRLLLEKKTQQHARASVVCYQSTRLNTQRDITH